jgi:hypothetical protein
MECGQAIHFSIEFPALECDRCGFPPIVFLALSNWIAALASSPAAPRNRPVRMQ